MDIATRARIKADAKHSEKVPPLALALIEAATAVGANIQEVEDACFAATSVLREHLRREPISRVAGDDESAFERFKEFLLALLA